MPVKASRRAWWTRLELLAWILHRRGPAVDEIAEVAGERGVRLLAIIEASIDQSLAQSDRRGPGKIQTTERVLAANRLLECSLQLFS
jgi:hypothetical protein